LFLTYEYAFQDWGSLALPPTLPGSTLVNLPCAEEQYQPFEGHLYKEFQAEALADHYPEILDGEILERLFIETLTSGHERGWPVLGTEPHTFVCYPFQVSKALRHIDHRTDPSL